MPETFEHLSKREKKEVELHEITNHLRDSVVKLLKHLEEVENPALRNFTNEELASGKHLIEIADSDLEHDLQIIEELAKQRRELKKFFPDFFGSK